MEEVDSNNVGSLPKWNGEWVGIFIWDHHRLEMMGQRGESGCQGFFSESAGRRPREISFWANSIWLGVRVEEEARGREQSKIS